MATTEQAEAVIAVRRLAREVERRTKERQRQKARELMRELEAAEPLALGRGRRPRSNPRARALPKLPEEITGLVEVYQPSWRRWIKPILYRLMLLIWLVLIGAGLYFGGE
jgi:hypothetical protein